MKIAPWPSRVCLRTDWRIKERSFPGSTRVGSRVGDCVSQSQASVQRLFRRDAETNTRGPSRTGVRALPGVCCCAHDGFEDPPDVFQEDFVAGGVGMNEIGQIQFRISGYSI